MCNKGMYTNYMKYSIDISKVARFVHKVVHFSNFKSTITNHQST